MLSVPNFMLVLPFALFFHKSAASCQITGICHLERLNSVERLIIPQICAKRIFVKFNEC